MLCTPLAVSDILSGVGTRPRLCQPLRFVTLATSATGSARDITRHAPRASGLSFLSQTKKESTDQTVDTFFLAGAEGFEPSARGFGDRCSTN